MKPYGIVYAFRLKGTNEYYIGQTTKGLETRSHQHLLAGKNHNKSHPKFNAAIRQHGFENFKSFVLASARNRKELNKKEQFFIWLYDSGKTGFNADPEEVIQRVMQTRKENCRKKGTELEKKYRSHKHGARMLTVEEASRETGLSVKQIKDLCKQRRFPIFQPTIRSLRIDPKYRSYLAVSYISLAHAETHQWR